MEANLDFLRKALDITDPRTIGTAREYMLRCGADGMVDELDAVLLASRMSAPPRSAPFPPLSWPPCVPACDPPALLASGWGGESASGSRVTRGRRCCLPLLRSQSSPGLAVFAPVATRR